MKDNEIIKAFGICYEISDTKGCNDCPFRDDMGICLSNHRETLEKKMFDLVNRQRTEIVRLHIQLKDGIALNDNVLKLVKSEAIKEFDKRFKETATEITEVEENAFKGCYVISKANLYNLVKEMVGDVHENKSV